MNQAQPTAIENDRNTTKRGYNTKTDLLPKRRFAKKYTMMNVPKDVNHAIAGGRMLHVRPNK